MLIARPEPSLLGRTNALPRFDLTQRTSLVVPFPLAPSGPIKTTAKQPLAVSGDGRHVAFASILPILPGLPPRIERVYVLDLVSSTLTRVPAPLMGS